MDNQISVETRPYQKGDEKELNAILKKIYNQDFNDAYWWWKYLNNPMGFHFCHCALIDGRIVGFAGGIPYRIKWNGREIIGAQLTDLAVEPELQGKKVFSTARKSVSLKYGKRQISFTDSPTKTPIGSIITISRLRPGSACPG